jgi:hypothetical protein
MKEGATGAHTADKLLPGDFASAKVGISDIIRLHDLARYDDGEWVPIPEGIIITPDLDDGEKGEPEHFHPRYTDGPPAPPK